MLKNRYFEKDLDCNAVDCSFKKESYHDEFYFVDNVIAIKQVKDPDKQKLIDSYKDQTDLKKIVSMLTQTGDLSSLCMPNGSGEVDFTSVADTLEDTYKMPEVINNLIDQLPVELRNLPLDEILNNYDSYLKKEEVKKENE